MPLPSEKRYTVDDIYALPEGQRAELIDGQLFYMAPPARKHQDIVVELSSIIKDYIRNHAGECKVYPAPFAVFLGTKEGDENRSDYVEPDISVICDRGKLNEKGCLGAPDWIVEVVSPSSRKRDYYQKLALYQTNGVREYWIVDPDKKLVIVYDLEYEKPPVLYPFTDTVPVRIYEDLAISFAGFDIQ